MAHMHPRVRKCLDSLRHEIKDSSGKVLSQINVQITKEGAEDLFNFLKHRATQAAYETKKELFKEASFINLILHSACEQFEDSLIRSGDSKKEFKRFARSYKDLLWPDIFKTIDSQNAYIKELAKRFGSVINILDKIEEVNNV
ncbi:MAG: hypothetical protein HQK76_19100 [Desulfobacterales bacterium]|nr:hypothetical protein [Desulfobacterales bacterium]